MITFIRVLFAVAAPILLSACGFTKGKETALKAVEGFHQDFNDAKYTEIYTAASPAFKGTTKDAEFLKFMEAVHRKLGAYKTGTENAGT